MVGAQGAFQSYLQALRTAAGRDYLNGPRPNASFLAMLRVMETIGPPPVYPYRTVMGPTYGSWEFFKDRAGFSHGGHFSEGFGAIAQRYKPAYLWFYQHAVEPEPAARDFDTPSLYPHRPMLALINWPTFSGVQERNPAEVLPKVHRDNLYDYFVFRNRWQDRDDIVTTALINMPEGTRPHSVMVWGLGTRNDFGDAPFRVRVNDFQPGQDGSGTLSAANWALAVDYSGASGADALVVSVGNTVKPDARSDKVRITTLGDGKTAFNILTLSSAGRHPEAKADGDKLLVGKQTVTFSGGRLTLGVLEPPK
jgi:hypothetical protein